MDKSGNKTGGADLGDCTTCLLASFADGKWGHVAGP